MVLGLVGGAVVGLVAAPTVVSAAEGGNTNFVVEAPRQVGNDSNPVRLYVQPQVAVDPDDPSVLALATGEARNGGCPLNVSRDGGLSWQLAVPTLMPDELPFCVQRNYGPVLDMAFASDGTLYVGMSGSSFDTDPPHPNGPITALIARTNDLGKTHQTFVVAEPDPFTFTPDPSAAPSAAPSASASADPSAVPSESASADPSAAPSASASADPSAAPSASASADPSAAPSASASADPSAAPSESAVPSESAAPSAAPSASASASPAPAAGSPPPSPAATEQTGFEQHRLNSVAVDPNNPEKVYRGWRQGIGGLIGVPRGATPPVRAMIAVSNDGGETWGDPIDVADGFEGDEEIFGSDVPVLVVDPDGTVFGFTKERPRRGAEGEPTPVSRLFMFKSTDGGENWTTSVFSPGAESIDNPDAAVDPSNGNLYVVYSSRGENTDDDEPSLASELYFLSSTDGGATWSEPINLPGDDPTKGADQYHPGISVAPNGRIDLAWHDFRNDPFFTPFKTEDMGVDQRYWDAYYASSTNAGGTWSANTRVTNPSIDGKLGTTFSNNDIRGPMGVASSDNAAYVTWADSRATGADGEEAEDAYFSRIRYADPVALGASAGGPKLTWAGLGAGVALLVGGLALLVASRVRGAAKPASRPAAA